MAGPYKEYWIRDNVLKRHKDYPQQLNEHHALHDARWNQSLYNFLKNFKR